MPNLLEHLFKTITLHHDYLDLNRLSRKSKLIQSSLQWRTWKLIMYLENTKKNILNPGICTETK